jgi:predicted Zn-dependent protease
MLSYLVGVTEQMAARLIAAVMTALIGVSSVQAQQLLDIPGDPQLGNAVRTFRSGFVQTEVIRLRMSGQLGCAQHCATITRAFDRIHRAARLQAPGMRNLKLVVTRDPTVDAWASATGHIFISEKFITRLDLTESEIALALAHEVMHVLLAHEAASMTLVKALNPVHRKRALVALYEDMDSDLSLMISLAPILKEQEHEADESGLMLAALAGYAPAQQIGLFRKLQATAVSGLTITHPSAVARLERIEGFRPIATRIHQRYGAH